MSTGYTRNDTPNNIADGNIINASDLDGEFDAIQTAFDATNGHTHDGTVGEGAPIEVIGPTQDVVVTASALRPKTDNTVDLGTPSLEFKDLYLDGTANIDSLVADTADINGGTIDGATIATSDITVGAGKTLDVSAGTFTLAADQISGDSIQGGTIGSTTIITLDSTTGNITNVNADTVDTFNIEVTNIKAKDGTAAATIADSTGVVTVASAVLTTADINGGTIDGVTIGGASAGAITGTTITGTSFVTTGDMTFGDNDKAIFGAGSDLQIFHDPALSTNFMSSQVGANISIGSSGFVNVGSSGSNLNVDGAVALVQGNDQVSLSGATVTTTTGPSGVVLDNNNVQKFATTATGIDVTGTVTADGLTVDGATEIRVSGAGSAVDAMKIYNTDGGSNNSQVQVYFGASDYDTAGRGLLLDAGRDSGADGIATFYAVDQAEHSDYEAIKILTDGGVTLSHLGSNKLATTATGIDVTGTVTADGLTVTGTLANWSIDTQGVIQTFTRPSTSYIRASDAAGNIGIQTGGSINRALFASNGDISFYEDTGSTPQMVWDASADALTFGDNVKATFGAGSDLQIYHDGSNSYVRDAGAGDLRITADSRVIIGKHNDENMIRATADGAVDLYYDNAAKLATTATGIDVTGAVVADGLVLSGNVTMSSALPVINLIDSDGTNQLTQIIQAGGGTFIDVRNNTSHGSFFVRSNDGGGLENRFLISSGGDISFYEDTGNTAKFFWDASAESLVIGTTSTAGIGEALYLNGGGFLVTGDLTSTNVNGFTLGYDSTNAKLAVNGTSGASRGMTFGTVSGGVEGTRMTIDSAGNVGIGTSSPRAILDLEGNAALDTDTATLTTTSQTSIATFAVATFDAAKVVITANNGTDTYITELLVAHDGTTAVATEYGQLSTDTFTVAYDVDISGGNVRILATPPAVTSTTFKVIKTLM